MKKLKLGELFLITYKGKSINVQYFPPMFYCVSTSNHYDDFLRSGGSLGREGDHDVIIPDLVCSKFHLTFTYDIKLQSYTCVDLGSRNGTILNGQRMSNSKQESEALKLDHGSVSGMEPGYVLSNTTVKHRYQICICPIATAMLIPLLGS